MSLDDVAVDPVIEQMVDTIRDRFGVSGLRAARTLIDQEITRYAQALADLAED